MAAVICTRFPHKAPELLAYQAAIVRAERNYEGTYWCRMSANTAGKPWHARTLTGRCQMHAFTMKHSLGMRRPSNAARSVFKMITTKTLAPEIPTTRSWGGYHKWGCGQCLSCLSRQCPNHQQLLRLGKYADVSMRADATSNTAANTYAPAPSRTRCFNAPTAHHQAAADPLSAGAPHHYLAKQPIVSSN